MGSRAPGELTVSTDKELLTRHVEGDADAFSEIVRRHRDRLWSVALKTLGDPEEAADALQDAFISAYRAAHTFRGDAAVTTWLHRITVNACLDRVRRARSRRTAPIPEPERLEVLLAREDSAEDPIERLELRRELSLALSELPVAQRAALVLVDMEGYPVAEVARILGIPVGTVKSRCSRGRARLLHLLRHLHPRYNSLETTSVDQRNLTSRGAVPLPRDAREAGTGSEGGASR